MSKYYYYYNFATAKLFPWRMESIELFVRFNRFKCVCSDFKPILEKCLLQRDESCKNCGRFFFFFIHFSLLFLISSDLKPTK